jgi:uncharacterized delta-60 repeat protein
MFARSVSVFHAGVTGRDLLQRSIPDADAPGAVPRDCAPRAIVFIDTHAPNTALLTAGVAPGMQAVLLDPRQDALALIAATLARSGPVDTVHIVAHGAPGELHFAAGAVSAESLASAAAVLAAIGKHLGAEGRLVLWGCEVAHGPLGTRFVEALGAATGVAIDASTHKVGSSDFGADWTLDASTARVSAQAPFTRAALERFSGVLVAPVIDLNGVTAGTGTTVTYTEQQAGGVTVASGLTITDSDSTNLASATVRISRGFQSGDALLFTNQFAISGNYSSATGLLTLTGPDTLAHFQAAMQSIRFEHPGDNPTGIGVASRELEWTVTDSGPTTSVPALATVNIAAVNDAIVNTVPAGTVTATEDTRTSITGLSVADADAGSQNVSVTLSVLHGVLDIATTGIPGGVNATEVSGDTTGTVVLTGTLAQINATLANANGLTYQPFINYTGADTLTITSNDRGNSGGAPTTDTDAVTLNVGPAAPTSTLTLLQTVTLTTDIDLDGRIDFGDTVRVDVQITNNSNVTSATGVSLAETFSGMADGTFNISPLAFDDSFAAVGNTLLEVGNATAQTGPQKSVAGSVTANDVQFDGAFTISSPAVLPTINGGTVHMVTSGPNMGSFTYISAANFTGADTFTYTITDAGLDGNAGTTADNLSTTATVTINVAGQVWYVDADAGAGGTGTSLNPFQSLADVTGATGQDDAGDTIYVREATGDYNGNMTLLANQQLIGSGADLVVGGSTLMAAGGATTIVNSTGDAITLNSGNTVSGFAIGNTTGAGVTGSNVGALTISNMSDTGTGKIIDVTGLAGNSASISYGTATTTSSASEAIKLTGINGSFNATVGAISGVTGTDVLVSGGTAIVNIGSSISSSAGGAVEVTGRGAGAGGVTFSGALNVTGGTGISVHDNTGGTTTFSASKVINTGAGSAVSIANNSGATVNFTNGGLDIDTTSGTAFSANSGTVNVSGAGNDITATAGQALNLTGVTGSTTFGTIASTGAGQGILISNVDNSTVSITGPTTINDATTDGIRIENSDNSTVTFGGKVTILNDVGPATVADGVDMNANAGSTINYNGGVDITVNGTGAFGFRATSSGSVNILDPAATSTQITSTNGTALLINPTAVNATLDAITSGGGASGISLTGMSGTGLTVGTVSLSGATAAGVAITDTTAPVTINGGTIAAGTGAIGVDINNGAANVSIASSVTKTTAGDLVEITGRTGGTVTLSGNLSATGTSGGLDIESNSGGTTTFSGASKTLNTAGTTAVTVVNSAAHSVTFSGTTTDIDTTTANAVDVSNGGTLNFNSTTTTINATSGKGLQADGGGTLTVTGDAQVTTTTGVAVDIQNTNIGVNDVTLQSVSANGAISGIIVNTTGTAASSGGLIVTGNGGSTADGSGGTIQNSTGTGISLTNTRDVSFDQMNVTGGGDDGIHGVGVVNFTLNRSNVNNNGNSTADDGLQFGEASGNVVGVTGNVSILASSISGNAHNNVHIRDTSGTIDNLTVTGSTFNNLNDTFGANSFLFEGSGTSTITQAFITGSTFANNDPQRALEVQVHDTATISDFVVSGNTFTNNGIQASFTQDISGNLEFYFVNNGSAGTPMTGSILQAVNVFSSSQSTGGTIVGTISGNFIGNQAVVNSGSTQGGGISATLQGQTDATLLIDGNTIRQTFGDSRGIYVGVRGPANPLAGTLGPNTIVSDITITNNNVIQGNTASNFGAAIVVEADNQTGADNRAPTLRADIRNNTVPDVATRPVNGEFFLANLIFYEYDTPGSMGIGQLVDSPPASANATAQLTGTNTGTSQGSAGITLIAGPINTPPPVPTPLLAAPGGVQAADTAFHDTTPSLPAAQVVEPSPPPPTASGQPGVQVPPAPTPSGESSVPAHSDPVPPPSGPTEHATDPHAGTPIVDDGVLSQAELDFTVAAAKARWIATGLTEHQVAALNAVTFTVENMQGLYLGSATPTAIKLDSDGAGYGWFLDATPAEDSEFANPAGATRKVAEASAAPAGHIDLVTTVMHEMGHVLGVQDTYDVANRDSLMYGYLYTGERRLPTADTAQGAVAGSIEHEEFSLAPISLGTLPAGKTVTVQFSGVVSPSQSNQIVVNPTASAAVTSSFAAANSVAVVTVDTLTLGNVVFEDINKNGTFESGEGVGGVALSLYADANDNDVADAGAIATTTTAAGGTYSFEGLAPGNYIVGVDAANFGAGAVLDGRAAIPGDIDPDNNVDTDSNARTIGGSGSLSRAITLDYGSEVSADTSPMLDVNNTLDFGFTTNVPPVIGNLNGDTVTFTEDGPAVLLDAGAAAVVSDADNLNFAGGTLTVSITAGKVSAEDVLGISQAGTIVLSGTTPGSTVTVGATVVGTIAASGTGANGDNLIVSLNSNATPTNITTLVQALTYSDSNPGNPSTADRTVSVSLNDGLGGTASVATTVHVTAVNDAPVLDAAKTPVVTAISEDAGAPVNGQAVGTLVSVLVDRLGSGTALDNVNDPDGAGVPAGLALIGTDTSHGSWFFSLNGGGTWSAVGSVSDSSALLLAADADNRLYFNPTPDFNGPVTSAITFRAWDTTSGADGASGVNTVPNGGTTAFSVATDTANLTVNAVADIADDAATVAEDSGISTINVLGNDSFENANSAITAVGAATHGTAALDDNLTPGDATDDFVTYTPTADYYGADGFTYTVTSGGVTETATVNVTVSPGVDIAADSVTVVEDSGSNTLDLLLNDTFENAGRAITAVGAALHGTATINTNGNADPTDDFVTYTPAANYSGPDTFTYTVTSGGATEQASVTVTVSPVADAAQISATTTNEDTQSASGLVVSRNAADGAEITHFKIGGITNGTLFQNNGTTPINNGDFITAAQGTAGLRFTPAGNLYSPVSAFSFNAEASLSNVDAGLGGGATNASITVNAVADTPTITNATTPEDVQSTSGLVIGRNTADAAEVTHFKITSITNGTLFQNDTATLINNGDFITFAQGAAGLKFWPTPDFNGTGNVTVQASTSNADAGLGGSQQSATITITEVNDPPTANADTVADIDEDSGTYLISIAGLIANDSKGPPDESLQTLSPFSVGNAIGGTVAINGGNIDFTPTLNFNGPASFDFTIQDDGTTNGVADPKTSTASVSFNVNSVNDAPVNVVPGNITVNEDTNFTITGLSFSDVEANTTPVTTLTLSVLHGTLTVLTTVPGGLDAAEVVGNGTGTVTLSCSPSTINTTLAALDGLVYRAQPDYNGADTLTVTSNDGGVSGSGGVLTDTDTVAITVFAVNDSPSFSVAPVPVTTQVGTADSKAYGLALQADGKIVLAGDASNGANRDFALVRYNADGSLDTSFSGDGKVVVPLAGDNVARAVAVDVNGIVTTILAAGTSAADFAITRFNSNGTLDGSFGTAGIATTNISGSDTGLATAVQTDHKILVAGQGGADFAVARYMPTGVLDTSFDADGIVTTSFSVPAMARAMALQAGGEIVVVGNASNDFALARYNADASLDTSFDGAGGAGNGRFLTDIGGTDVARGVIVQTDGKIVVVGESTAAGVTDAVLVRYNALDGTIDTGFGTAGVAKTRFGAASGGAFSVAQQADGKLVIAGYANGDFAVARFDTTGALDTSFDTDGIVVTAHAGVDEAHSVVVQPDGRIVVAGQTAQDFAVIRYNPDGSIDRTFGAANTLDGAPAYIENGAAVVLDANVQVTDIELAALGNYGGASLTLARSGPANAQDVFSATGLLGSISAPSGNVVYNAVVVGTYTNGGGTLTLSFNSSATEARVDGAMQSIAYSNSSDAPPSSVPIGWTFSDGNAGAQGGNVAASVSGSTTVSITAVNDAPAITSDGSGATATVSVPENQLAVTTVTASDPDTGATQAFSIVGGADAAKFAIGGSSGALRFVTAPDFEHPGSAASSNSYVVQVQVSDGAGGIDAQTLTVDVNDIDDAPRVLFGDSGPNAMAGFAGPDYLEGRGGNDSLSGMAGDDHLEGGPGADALDGGAGFDYARYFYAASGVSVDLMGVVPNTGEAVGDTFVNIEGLIGSEFDDFLYGDNNGNDIVSYGGNDYLAGRGGDDALAGGEGSDELEGGAGADWLNGGNGLDYASYSAATVAVIANLETPSQNTGDAAGDIYVSIEGLIGSPFADTLIGDSGNNALRGGGGSDQLEGRGGADSMDGGAGVDYASYQLSSAGVTIDLGAQMSAGDAVGDSFVSVEGVLGTAFGDLIFGDNGDNDLRGMDGADYIEGRQGNDSIRGGNGDDHLEGGAGADALDGGAGFDYARYFYAASGVTADLSGAVTGTGDAAGDIFIDVEGLVGSEFADSLYGNNNANDIVGYGGNDYLAGRGGDDALAGGEGSDELEGGAGADWLNGGNGLDYASYSAATVAVIANLETPSQNTGDAAGDIYVSIEGLIGSPFADTLIGDSGNNALRGGGGSDQLEGRGGADSMDGGAGVDYASYQLSSAGVTIDLGAQMSAGDAVGDSFVSVEGVLGTAFGDLIFGDNGDNDLRGMDGADYIEGRQGNDSIRGGNGDDHLEGGAGADALDGGAGFDYARYVNATAGVTADLAGAVTNVGDAAGDTFLDIEGLIGSEFADELRGNGVGNDIVGGGGDDRLMGEGGNDGIDGGAGNDTIDGGLGADGLTGGTGSDTFVYHAMGDAGDIVTDFTVGGGGDVLDLRELMATITGGNGASAFSGGYLQFSTSGADTLVRVDSDGGADSFIILATLTGALLQQSDTANYQLV